MFEEERRGRVGNERKGAMNRGKKSARWHHKAKPVCKGGEKISNGEETHRNGKEGVAEEGKRTGDDEGD